MIQIIIRHTDLERYEISRREFQGETTMPNVSAILRKLHVSEIIHYLYIFNKFASAQDGRKEPAPIGGYAFVETSEGAGDAGATDRAFLMSPALPASGPQGSCLFFM